MFGQFGCMPLWQTTCQGLRTIHGGGGGCCSLNNKCCEGLCPKEHKKPVETPPTPELSPMGSPTELVDKDSLGGGPPECYDMRCPKEKKPDSYADLHRKSARFYDRQAARYRKRMLRAARGEDPWVHKTKRGDHPDTHIRKEHEHKAHIHPAHEHPEHQHRGRVHKAHMHETHVHEDHVHEEHEHDTHGKKLPVHRERVREHKSARQVREPLRPCDRQPPRSKSAANRCGSAAPCPSDSSTSTTTTTTSSSCSDEECNEKCEWPFGCKFSCADPEPEYRGFCPGGGLQKRCAGKIGDGTRGWGTLIQKVPPELKPYNPRAPCGLGLPCGYRTRGKIYLPGPPGQVFPWNPCRPNPCGTPAICCKPCKFLPPLQPTPPGFATTLHEAKRGCGEMKTCPRETTPALRPEPFGVDASTGRGLPVNTSMSAIVALSLIAANHATGGLCSCPTHTLPPGATPQFAPAPPMYPSPVVGVGGQGIHAGVNALRLTRSEEESQMLVPKQSQQHQVTPVGGQRDLENTAPNPELPPPATATPKNLNQLTSTGYPFPPESWQRAGPGQVHPAPHSAMPNLGCGPYAPHERPGYPPVPNCLPELKLGPNIFPGGVLRGGGSTDDISVLDTTLRHHFSPRTHPKQSVTFASLGSGSTYGPSLVNEECYKSPNMNQYMNQNMNQNMYQNMYQQGGVPTTYPNAVLAPAFNPPYTGMDPWPGSICPNPLKVEVCGAPVPPQFVTTGPCSTMVQHLAPCGARPKLRQTCDETSTVHAPKCRDKGKMVTCGAENAKDKCGICKLMFDERCTCGRRRRSGPCAPWCLQPKPLSQLSRAERSKMKKVAPHTKGRLHGCAMPLVLPWQKQRRRKIGKVFEQLEREKAPPCMDPKWVKPCEELGECLTVPKDDDCPNLIERRPKCDSIAPQAQKCHEFEIREPECSGIVPAPTIPGIPLVAGPVPCGPYDGPKGAHKGLVASQQKQQQLRLQQLSSQEPADEWGIPTLKPYHVDQGAVPAVRTPISEPLSANSEAVEQVQEVVEPQKPMRRPFSINFGEDNRFSIVSPRHSETDPETPPTR